MQRYHAELPIILRHLRQAQALGKLRSAGYYRKQDAHDCGNPRCGICHPEKRFGHTLTRQERAAALRLREFQSE
jgi:hypothetical protein